MSQRYYNILNFVITYLSGTAQKLNTMKKIILTVSLALIGIIAQAQEETKMYDVRSGIVTMEMDMMGRKVVQEIYFDD